MLCLNYACKLFLLSLIFPFITLLSLFYLFLRRESLCKYCDLKIEAMEAAY